MAAIWLERLSAHWCCNSVTEGLVAGVDGCIVAEVIEVSLSRPPCLKAGELEGVKVSVCRRRLHGQQASSVTSDSERGRFGMDTFIARPCPAVEVGEDGQLAREDSKAGPSRLRHAICQEHTQKLGHRSRRIMTEDYRA